MKTERQEALRAYRQSFDVESRHGAGPEIRAIARHGSATVEIVFALDLVAQRINEDGSPTADALIAVELIEALVLMIPEINDLVSQCNTSYASGSTPSAAKLFLNYLERKTK